MTAEEFIEENEHYAMEILPHIEHVEPVYAAMREFAQYHVNQALSEQKNKLNDFVEYGAINKGWQTIQEHIKDVYKDKIQ